MMDWNVDWMSWLTEMVTWMSWLTEHFSPPWHSVTISVHHNIQSPFQFNGDMNVMVNWNGDWMSWWIEMVTECHCELKWCLNIMMNWNGDWMLWWTEMVTECHGGLKCWLNVMVNWNGDWISWWTEMLTECHGELKWWLNVMVNWNGVIDDCLILSLFGGSERGSSSWHGSICIETRWGGSQHYILTKPEGQSKSGGWLIQRGV